MPQALLVRQPATAYAPTMRTDIAFPSEGVTCRGWLYTPDARAAAGRTPMIVMAHGFSTVQEMRLEAPSFTDAAGAAVKWFMTHLGH